MFTLEYRTTDEAQKPSNPVFHTFITTLQNICRYTINLKTDFSATLFPGNAGGAYAWH
jgi:hypothetical protein